MLKLLSIVIFTAIGSVVGQTFYGLNYGIDTNNCPPYEKYIADFSQIKKYTNRVRTFALAGCNQGALALQAAADLNMSIYLGMWIDRPDTFNTEMNALQAIINNPQARLDKVEALIVGSEVLYRNDTTDVDLANYLKAVRQVVQGKNIPITTADVYYKFPSVVVDQIDLLMMNAFPYWEGLTVQESASALMQHYDSVVTKSKGKPVKISETGWPSEGDNFGSSVPSRQNQAFYLSQVLCQTRSRNIDLLWFSAMDEPYRSGVEGHWGLMDQNFVLKPELAASIANPSC